MPDPGPDPIHQRLRDGGPRYVETPADIDDFTGAIAEPWNTGSAVLFVIIAAAWAWALRGRYRDHPFLTMCLPILAAGGIGGVLFHGLRRHNAFFLLDVIPIYLLGMAVSIWIWVRLGPRLQHLLATIGFLALLQILAKFQLPRQWAINVSYLCLAILIVMPIVLALIRTRFRHAGWIYTAGACFAIAWIFRIADTFPPPLLPMGTHWLWHTFGALTTASLSAYVYLIEGMSLKESSEPLPPLKPPSDADAVTGGNGS